MKHLILVTIVDPYSQKNCLNKVSFKLKIKIEILELKFFL